MTGSASIVLTLDIDWAPDFVVDDVAGILIQAGVKSTWFVTHASPAVDRLKSRPDLFELGMHPNFFPKSSHGDTHAAVFSYCRALVPEARTMRTHGLVQSTPLLDMAIDRGVEIDVSLYTPHSESVAPLDHWREGKRLWRIPYVWEDDFEMDRPQPMWSIAPLAVRKGIQMLDFHPIHVWLNGADMAPYRTLKERCPRLLDAKREDAADLRRDRAGPGAMFRDAVGYLARLGRTSFVRDIPPALVPA
jgi:hypothetical protein